MEGPHWSKQLWDEAPASWMFVVSMFWLGPTLLEKWNGISNSSELKVFVPKKCKWDHRVLETPGLWNSWSSFAWWSAEHCALLGIVWESEHHRKVSLKWTVGRQAHCSFLLGDLQDGWHSTRMAWRDAPEELENKGEKRNWMELYHEISWVYCQCWLCAAP